MQTQKESRAAELIGRVWHLRKASIFLAFVVCTLHLQRLRVVMLCARSGHGETVIEHPCYIIIAFHTQSSA